MLEILQKKMGRRHAMDACTIWPYAVTAAGVILEPFWTSEVAYRRTWVVFGIVSGQNVKRVRRFLMDHPSTALSPDAIRDVTFYTTAEVANLLVAACKANRFGLQTATLFDQRSFKFIPL